MDQPDIVFQFDNCFAPRCADSPTALTAKESSEVNQAAGEIHAKVEEKRKAGGLSFLDLVDQGPIPAQIKGYAEEAFQRFDTYINLGIGGSSLGAIALMGLKNPFHHQLSADQRDGLRCYFPENIDPVTFSNVLALADPKKTLFGVISKSGSTAETMSQYLIARAWLAKHVGEKRADAQMVFVTDANAGSLRPLVQARKITAFTIPDGVGGRFSVLCPVGLLPGALMGLDIDALLAGTQRMANRCASDDPASNPALAASAIYHALMGKGVAVSVLMPYADALGGLARWYVQLISESLGKRLDRAGKVVHAGITPVAAIGATDQHSQLQLFMEGPHDKLITLIAVESRGCDLEIPPAPAEIPGLGYLSGHTLGELLEAEQMATEMALTKSGRPNMKISLPRLDEAALGGLFYFFELLTVYLGEWMKLDAFDQPGVESGKRYTYGRMGREGFAQEAEEVRKFFEE